MIFSLIFAWKDPVSAGSKSYL